MPKISKKSSFFRRNHFLILGGFWGFMGLALIIVQANEFIAYPYTILGLLYAGYGFMKKDLPLEFIRWDQEKLEIRMATKHQGLQMGEYRRHQCFSNKSDF